MHTNNFNLIRLLAALQVLIVHGINHFEISGWALDAFKAIPGVPTFFLISGYLIGASYQRRGPAGIRQFFKNRFLRIYPGLWFCVVITTIAMLLTGYLHGREVSLLSFASWVAGQASFVQFYNPGFMRQFGTGVLNGALWTISVEIQFYLLVPLMYHLLKSHRAWLLALFLVSVGVNLMLRLDPDNETLLRKLITVSFLPWIYMFLIGFAGAYYRTVAAKATALPYTLLVPTYLFSQFFVGNFTQNATNAIHPLSVAVLSILILKFGTARLSLPGWSERLVQGSDFSYGLYLYHMPIINILLYVSPFGHAHNFAIAIAVSIAAAVLSWFLIEQPALSKKVATPA